MFSKTNERMIAKLDRKFRGPFKITSVLPNHRYEVIRSTKKGKSRSFKFAHDQLIIVPEGEGEVSVETDDPSVSEPEPALAE